MPSPGDWWESEAAGDSGEEMPARTRGWRRREAPNLDRTMPARTAIP